MTGTAHQKLIRDRLAKSRADEDLFGAWWESVDLTLARSVIKPIGEHQAWPIIKKYEWLGTMPAVVLHCYGIFFDGCLGGVAVFSPEYAENLGVWDKYGYSGKIICLSRGACAYWTPKGTGSRLVAGACRLLPSKYEIVTATVDSEAGEIGTIYQSCNWYYVGQMSKGGKRLSYLSNGRLMSGRQAKRDFGTRGVVAARQLGVAGVKSVDRKGRYFHFRGCRAARRDHKRAIQHLIKPYPKRGAE